MRQKPETLNWCIPVTKVLDEAVEKSVRQGTHVSKSDLVRDAVRRLLNVEKEEKEKTK